MKRRLSISAQSVLSQVLIKMPASVIVTVRIMPEAPDTDLTKVEHQADTMIVKFGGKVAKKDIVPIAFGLKALDLHFVMKEDIGSTEDLENQLRQIQHVNSVEVVDVRRTVG